MGLVTEEIKDFLTDLEKEKINLFCQDKEMYMAVQKVLLQGLYSHGVVGKETYSPLQNGAFNLAALSIVNPIPNEEIGAQVRAQFAGLNALKNAFESLDSIKVDRKPVLSEFNEAV